MNTKQIIVVRTDLKMGAGKIAAQACHASISFLTRPGLGHESDEIEHWINNSFRKIVCAVNSEQELIEVHEKAIKAGLNSYLIEDNGATVFDGVKTKTCCGIGPHWDDKFKNITDKLQLHE